MDEKDRGNSRQMQELASQLAASEARLRSIIERSPDAFLIVDRNGMIQYVNPAAVALFGNHESQMLGRPFGLPVTAGEKTDVDIVNRRGEDLIAEMRVMETDWDGTKAHVAVLRDITERKHLEEDLRRMNDELERRIAERTAELNRSNQELQQFAFIAAHDLQTPLRAIMGFSQLLSKEYRGRFDDRADEWLARLVAASRRMHDLIRDVLAYSRVDSQGGDLRPIDCGRLFDEAVAALDPSIREAGARVSRGDLPVVVGDPGQLAQVLQNLIDNGIKYHGAEPPQVHVSAGRQGREWVFSVRDNGIGIAEKHREQIFDIFHRLHTQQAYPGTGIGLAICRRVIHRHGGRIWVESEPGRGSVFHFTIPDRDA